MIPATTAPFATMNSFLKSVDWPVMPEVGQALIATLSDEDASLQSVCQIIGRDPVFTATLLRMANSALFGLSGSVDTLERAVSVVGLSLIRARALAICMAKASHLPVGLDRVTFWRYCMLCAGYAQWLAGLSSVNQQEAWLAGMMLRLGEISLGQVRPFALGQIEAQPIKPGERWLRERALIGFDEGQITAELAEHWDLPPVLVAGLRYVAQPLVAPDLSRLAVVLHLAARLADSGEINANALEDLPVLALQILGLQSEALAENAPDPNTLTDISIFES